MTSHLASRIRGFDLSIIGDDIIQPWKIYTLLRTCSLCDLYPSFTVYNRVSYQIVFQNNLIMILGKNIVQNFKSYPSDLTKLFLKSNLTFENISNGKYFPF